MDSPTSLEVHMLAESVPIRRDTRRGRTAKMDNTTDDVAIEEELLEDELLVEEISIDGMCGVY
jgi:mycofactocin precursor